MQTFFGRGSQFLQTIKTNKDGKKTEKLSSFSNSICCCSGRKINWITSKVLCHHHQPSVPCTSFQVFHELFSLPSSPLLLLLLAFSPTVRGEREEERGEIPGGSPKRAGNGKKMGFMPSLGHSCMQLWDKTRIKSSLFFMSRMPQ